MRHLMFLYLLVDCVQAAGLKDMTTTRANTLYDDADDLQRQLNNEARDKFATGQATNWVFHFPTSHRYSTTEIYRPRPRAAVKIKDDDYEYKESIKFADQQTEWGYKNQNIWAVQFPDCAGKAQSPVSLPYSGLVKVTGGRELVFRNHDVPPTSLSMVNNGTTIKMTGVWDTSKRPLIQGGAVQGRRYLFDSIQLHWPSEHTIDYMQYPVESQIAYVSVEYPSMTEALYATDDKMAILIVSNLYTIANNSHEGISSMLMAALNSSRYGTKVEPRPLSYFNPPFKEYVCYQGSLTTPPCTESVVWLVRARSLPVTKELFKATQDMKMDGEPERFMFRESQPMNDRKVYLFN